jgi:hypothetical protein
MWQPLLYISFLYSNCVQNNVISAVQLLNKAKQ